MSVLIEHQVSNPCTGRHSWTLPLDMREDGRVVGMVRQCMICGTVVEFRLDGEYPDE